MAADISIEDAPDQIVQGLRERAAEHQRSVQAELRVILEAAVAPHRPGSPSEVLSEVRRLGLTTPNEATALIRADRDGR